MILFRNLKIALVCLIGLCAVRPASACPFCKEALDKPDGAAAVVGRDDPLREQRAYNYSIYVMVAMPYFLLSVVGFLVYRGMKQKALAEQQAREADAPNGQGEPPCPPSVADSSSPQP